MIASPPLNNESTFWTPPSSFPQGHIGPIRLPESGRIIWWTGRVAIGLRHEPSRRASVSA